MLLQNLGLTSIAPSTAVVIVKALNVEVAQQKGRTSCATL
jgi:hypothetical protein